MIKTQTQTVLPSHVHQWPSKPKRIKLSNSENKVKKSTPKRDYFDIVRDIDNDPKFKEYLLNYKFFDDQFDSIAENCFDDDQFADYLLEKVPEEETETPKAIEQNRQKHVVLFQFEQWKKLIRKFISTQCLSQLDSLKAIVIGTVGFTNFTTTCMVADNKDYDHSNLSQSVVKFKDFLNQVYSGEHKQLDFFSEHAKKNGFLFINTCLSNNTDDIVNCLCTTEFVNRIIAQFHQTSSQKLTILDFRLTSYINRKETDPQVQQDNAYYNCSQRADDFLLKTNDRVIRLGSPARWFDIEAENDIIKSKLKEFSTIIGPDGYLYLDTDLT